MTRPASLYLILSLLIFGGLGAPPAAAGPEPVQVNLLDNQEYVGAIDHKNTRYLKVTLINLVAGASTCRIAFYKKRIELNAEKAGPVEFRTFTLEELNDSQTRIWTTLNFDEFTLNATAGNLQVIVEKTMYCK